jgi:hypothetical protein
VQPLLQRLAQALVDLREAAAPLLAAEPTASRLATRHL